MSALVLLEGLNDLLDDAARTAEDLEREIDGALPPRETREERKRLRRERSEREPFGGGGGGGGGGGSRLAEPAGRRVQMSGRGHMTRAWR